MTKIHPAFQSLVAQEKIRETLTTLVEIADRKANPFSNSLFLGEPGVGKTTLANRIAKACDVPIKVVNCASLKNEMSVILMLYELTNKQILFLDEIHALSAKSQNILLTSMDQGYINVTSSSVGVETFTLPPHCVIGASNSTISNALLQRFKYIFEMEDYRDEHIAQIIENYVVEKQRNPFNYDLLAVYARQNPRLAKNLADWIADWSLVNNVQSITDQQIIQCMDKIQVFQYGLTRQDLIYLNVLKSFNSPVGIESIAGSTNMDRKLIESKIEPYLLKCGFIMKMKTGRIIIKKRMQDWLPEISKI